MIKEIRKSEPRFLVCCIANRLLLGAIVSLNSVAILVNVTRPVQIHHHIFIGFLLDLGASEPPRAQTCCWGCNDWIGRVRIDVTYGHGRLGYVQLVVGRPSLGLV